MFVKARIKLTAWYLLVIMVVSFTFSGVIYRASNFELKRFAEAQRVRFERRFVAPPPLLDDELLEEARMRIINSLIVINLGILTVAGFLGYYLSGKTLAPIQEMVDDQYRFVSDASHELKTPITAIKTTLEVAIRDKNLSLKEAVITIDSSLEEVNRLQRLAEALLELTHNKVPGNYQPKLLNDVVEQATRMLLPIAVKKNIEVEVKIPRIFAKIDEVSFGRAMLAIMENAVKYSHEKSKIVVKGSIEKKLIILKVIDKGIGIAKENIPNIFDRFYRADSSRSTNGYGLGLSIANVIIAEHKGTIAVESKLGKGTTIIVALPFSARIQKLEIN